MAIDMQTYVNSYASITRYCAEKLIAKASPAIRAGHKCRSCGSLEYVMAASGSICAYCRTPEFAGSSDTRPTAVDREWGKIKAENSLRILSSMYGIAVPGK